MGLGLVVERREGEGVVFVHKGMVIGHVEVDRVMGRSRVRLRLVFDRSVGLVRDELYQVPELDPVA